MPDFLLTEVDVIAVSLCKRGANGKRIFLKKVDGEPELDFQVRSPIFKSEGANWRVAYTVVAEPGNEELPGVGAGSIPGTTDAWASEDEILKAAHGFMRNGGLINFQHKDLDPVGRVVENFIAPADFEVVDPTGVAQTIKKGSWVIGIEPNDDMRTMIDRGEVDGVSYEGLGTRNPVAKSEAGLTDQDAIVALETAMHAEDRTLLERIAQKLGLSTDDEPPKEDDDVALTDEQTAALAKVEGIESTVTAHGATIEDLSSKIDTLLARIPEPEKPAEEQQAELAKTVDALAEQLADAQEQLASLAQGGSTQGSAPDTLKKTDDPDAALASALFA